MVLSWWNYMGCLDDTRYIQTYIVGWAWSQYAWDCSVLIRDKSKFQMTSKYWQLGGQFVSPLISIYYQLKVKGLSKGCIIQGWAGWREANQVPYSDDLTPVGFLSVGNLWST